MTATLLHSANRNVVIAVPERGPLACLFAVGSPTVVFECIREMKPAIDAMRPGRANHPLVFGLSREAFETMKDVHLSVLTKALAAAGFSAAGVLADAPSAPELSDRTDLLLQDGPQDGTYEALAFHRACLEEEARRAEEAAAWDAALIQDAAVNAAQEATAWDDAMVENALVDARREAERLARVRAQEEEAAAWDEALAADAAFNEAQLERDWAEALIEDVLVNRRAEAQAWDEALVENARVDALREALRREALERRQAQEAEAWDEAVAHDALLNRANEVARQVHEAVMRGDVPAVALPPAPSAPAVEAASDDAEVAVTEAPVAAKTLVSRSRVRSGSQIYAEGCDLILFGGLSAGGEAIADGNVNIVGPAHGRVFAGSRGDTNVHVICQQFHAELISIGGRYANFETIPDELRGAPVHFWVEADGLHYRRLNAPEPA